MATPEEPPVPQDPAPVQSSPSDSEIRDLATSLAKLGTDQADLIRKATVTVVNTATGTVPTVDVQFPAANNPDGSAGTPVTVPGIRTLDSYSPVVGDVALLLKQGTDLVAIGQINDSNQGGSVQGWATLTGSLQYRKVADNGDFKVQLKGYWSVSGTTVGTLPAGFRPTTQRGLAVAANSSFGLIKVFVESTGDVTIAHPTNTATETGMNHTHDISTNDHSHGGGSVAFTGNTSTISNHSHPTPGTSANGGHNHTYGIAVTTHGHSTTATSNGIDHNHGLQATQAVTVFFDGTEFFL